MAGGRRPRLRWELLACAFGGHALVGTDAAALEPRDGALAREIAGARWHRCLRCDAWLPVAAPTRPARDRLPARAAVELPLRGRALRDRIVLRLIALDRALHFLVLGAIAAGIFLFARNRSALEHDYYTLLTRWQAAGGGPVSHGRVPLLHDLNRLFSLSGGALYLLGVGIAVYAALEGTEAIGLWLERRWAEYLTLVATAVFLPLEVYELSRRLSGFRIAALVINLAIVVYLLLAKRLFGLRGGVAAERRLRERDSGWPAIDAATPP
jgi:uncharacterized membrane protein (DUF2068 family)